MSEETVRSGPVDLSRESDFAIGAFKVSPPSREVILDGARESLEPKAMQVLVALHQAEGRVVYRLLAAEPGPSVTAPPVEAGAPPPPSPPGPAQQSIVMRHRLAIAAAAA